MTGAADTTGKAQQVKKILEKAHTGIETPVSTISPEKPTSINVDREELLKILIRIENALSEVRELKAKIQK